MQFVRKAACSFNRKRRAVLPEFAQNKELVDFVKTEKNGHYYLNTMKLCDKFIVMDDNKTPYYLTSLDELIKNYLDVSMKGNLDSIKAKSVSITVPLYRRIFIDAPRAMNIYKSLFLENVEFIEDLQMAYGDPSWGTKPENPLIWRMYLTASRSYKLHKIKYTEDKFMRHHYMEWSLPRFIWVLELGTIDTYQDKKARVEIIIDATSSQKSVNCGILSIGYKNHYIMIQDDIYIIEEQDEMTEIEMLEEEEEYSCDEIIEEDYWDILDDAVKWNFLTKMFSILYNNKCTHFDETYKIFIDSNLEGNFDNGSTTD